MILLLPQVTDLRLVLMTNTKYIVYRFQALKLNPTEYLRFIVMGKPIEKRMPWHNDT